MLYGGQQMSRWTRFSACLCLSAFAHFLAFPLISLSTMEFKPRSTYIEENSLLPASLSTYELPIVESSLGLGDRCEDFEALGFSCFRRPNLMFIITRPSFYDDNKDILVIVALPDRSPENGPNSSIFSRTELFSRFLGHLDDGRYLSKTIVLLIPLTESIEQNSDSIKVIFSSKNRLSKIRHSVLSYFDVFLCLCVLI